MWRVNTSSTQARQIRFSKSMTDSGGNAERSRGVTFLTLFAGSVFAAAGFLTAGFRFGFGTDSLAFIALRLTGMVLIQSFVRSRRLTAIVYHVPTIPIDDFRDLRPAGGEPAA